MKKSIPVLALTFMLFFDCLAQEHKMTEKPGTFHILSRTNYTAPDCGFTKADMTANLGRITDLVSVVRQNPVLSDIRGFEGSARLYNVSCKDNGGYGIPSRIRNSTSITGNT